MDDVELHAQAAGHVRVPGRKLPKEARRASSRRDLSRQVDRELYDGEMTRASQKDG